LSGTAFPDFFAALAAPFPPSEVKTRAAGGGRQLSYISARAVSNRLDNVCGPEKWKNEYFVSGDGLRCRLWIKTPDGEWVFKEDGGGFAPMPDADDAQKSGYSSAFKRAAAQWGVGRELYNDGVADYVEGGQPPQRQSYSQPRQDYAAPQRQPDRQAPAPQGGKADYGRLPTSGGALFAWSKSMEEKYQVGLIKYLDSWAKLQDFPRSYKEWSPEMIELGVAEAVRKLDSISGGQSQPQPPPQPARAPTPEYGPADDTDSIPF
jgi:hypothetical protein